MNFLIYLISFDNLYCFGLIVIRTFTFSFGFFPSLSPATVIRELIDWIVSSLATRLYSTWLLVRLLQLLLLWIWYAMLKGGRHSTCRNICDTLWLAHKHFYLGNMIVLADYEREWVTGFRPDRLAHVCVCVCLFDIFVKCSRIGLWLFRHDLPYMSAL